MELPKSVKIGCHTIEIQPVNQEVFIDDYPGDERGEDYIGEYVHHLNKIRLLNILKGTRMAVTLMHEIIEAINWQNDLDMSHCQISCIAEALTDVIISNDLDLMKIAGKR